MERHESEGEKEQVFFFVFFFVTRTYYGIDRQILRTHR